MAPTSKEVDDEKAVLAAIYGEDFVEQSTSCWHFSFSLATLTFYLPDSYPSAPPVAMIEPSILDIEDLVGEWDPGQGVHPWVLAVEDVIRNLEAELVESVAPQDELPSKEAPAEKTADEIVDESRRQVIELRRESSAKKLDQKGKSSASAYQGPHIYHGPYFTEKKSTFQAHAAKIQSKEDADAVWKELMTDKKVAASTHNMFAYRFKRSDGSLVADNDDDGEAAAGTKLAELLDLMGSEDVFVMVSRWYGGILLGPLRFKIISKVAADLLRSVGLAPDGRK